jgi:DNA-binding NarL/FixJ family response regulator
VRDQARDYLLQGAFMCSQCKEETSVVGIRTALVSLSPLLSDIITQAIKREIELDVVAQISGRGSLEQQLRLIDPDLILIGLRVGETDAIAATALAAAPAAKVIAFSADCRHAYLHEMRACQSTLINVTPAALAEAILGPHTGTGPDLLSARD